MSGLIAVTAVVATWLACVAWSLPNWIGAVGPLLIGAIAIVVRVRSLRTPAARRRLAAGGVGVAFVAATAPLWISVIQDRLRFVRECKEEIRRAEAVNWRGWQSADQNLAAFEALRVRVHELDRRSAGDRLLDAVVGGSALRAAVLLRFGAGLEEGFGKPCMTDLEGRFRSGRAGNYAVEHRELKAYLTLTKGRGIAVDDAAALLASLWSEKLLPTSRSATRVESLAASLVLDELRWLSSSEIAAREPDVEVVAAVRRRLHSVDPKVRAFALLVTSVELETAFAQGRPRTRSFPSVSLATLFGGRFEKLRALESQLHRAERRGWFEVAGPYTAAGRERVLENISAGRAILEREAWVDGGDATVELRAVDLRALEAAYVRNYVDAWSAWLSDLRAVQPATIGEARELYQAMTDEEAPLAIALRALAANTQPGTSAVARQLVPPRISSFFASTAEFWSGHDATVPAAMQLGSPLSLYLARLKQVRLALGRPADGDAGRLPSDAAVLLAALASDTGRSLAGHDAFAQQILVPLLLEPLSIDGVAPLGRGDEPTEPSTVEVSRPLSDRAERR